MFQPCEVVLLPFPFSDLGSTKRRPALILRSLETYGDIVAWQSPPAQTTQRAWRLNSTRRSDANDLEAQ